MSTTRRISDLVPVFPYAKWGPLVRHLARQYRAAAPFPHIYLAPFLEPEVAETAAEDFPESQSADWIRYKHGNENKMGLNRRALFPDSIKDIVDELNSPPFVAWLSELTGISNLIADPTLDGGGLHQAERNGFLNVHTDFSVHHYRPHWQRRVNLIVYLTPEWRDEWGGALEFWDARVKKRAVHYFPRFNHAVIFNTDDCSFHGFPDPLRCPEHLSRRSLALYYYTSTLQLRPLVRATTYRPRPEDSWLKSALIRLDTCVVNFYSKAKRRYRFSDRVASRLLHIASVLKSGPPRRHS
jgi:2OG-Fe(II) oxygenase superfamily